MSYGQSPSRSLLDVGKHRLHVDTVSYGPLVAVVQCAKILFTGLHVGGASGPSDGVYRFRGKLCRSREHG